MSTDPTSFRRQATTEAAAWFTTLQQACTSEREREEFTRWLAQSARHVEEYLAVATVWRVSSEAGKDAFSKQELIEAARRDLQTGRVMQLPGALAKAGTRHPLWRPPAWVAAASVSAVAVVIAISWMFLKPGPIEYRTHSGDRLTAMLADGSTVRLNTGTHVRVYFSASSRRIELLGGEALFEVARDVRRPFRVVSGNSEIRAIGTAFNVVHSETVTTVTVIEGQVELAPVVSMSNVSSGGGVLRLAPRQRASVDSMGKIFSKGEAVDLRVATSWTQPQLRFSDEPLRAVLAQFNQYNSTQLVLDDTELGAIRISGAFSSSDLGSFMEYLKRTEHVRVQEAGPRTRVLRGP